MSGLGRAQSSVVSHGPLKRPLYLLPKSKVFLGTPISIPLVWYIVLASVSLGSENGAQCALITTGANWVSSKEFLFRV